MDGSTLAARQAGTQIAAAPVANNKRATPNKGPGALGLKPAGNKASSKIRIDGFSTSARAISSLCRCPPERLPPPSDTLALLEVSYAGLAPGWVGLYQINFRLPDSETSGSKQLYFQTDHNTNQAPLWVK